MAVDELCRLACDGDIGKQCQRETCADGGAADSADDRLAAVDHVVDEVACFFPSGAALLEIDGEVLSHVEVAAGRKSPASPSNDHAGDVLISVDVTPDICEFPMCGLNDGVEALR